MDINRNNYEAFLLDLAEGRLNAEETRQLRDFLQLNPDCTAVLDLEQLWFLESGSISFPGKDRLKKEFPGQNSDLAGSDFGLFSIARLEGDLTRKQELDYMRVVREDKEKFQEWLAWKQTKLVGEPIIYKGKGRLKRGNKPNSRIIWISVVSAAAAVAFIILLVRLVPVDEEPVLSEPGLAVEPVLSEQERITETEISHVETGKILADKPVTLTIRKHQDPPELTGMDKDPVPVREKADSTLREIQEIHEQKIKAMPVQVAMLEKYPRNIAEKGIYDRITPLYLPPVSSQTRTQIWAQFSDKGLKQTYRDYIGERDLSLLTVANAGIKGINRLTGADLALNISRNDAGEVSGFRFRSNRMSVVAPVERTE